MSLLAVLDRELRSSARKPITWRVRIIIPGLAFLFCVFSLWVVTLAGGRAIPGRDLFEALKWIAFGCALLTSCTFPADSISSEKRDGTLGLLFLTPLRGYHIAFGKFISAAVGSLYSLLAVFPMMALPFLMGGVGPKEFLFTMIALVITTLLALGIGLFISTISLQPWKAVGLALFITVFMAAVLPALAAGLAFKYHRPDLASYLFSLSPSYFVYIAGVSAWRLAFINFWQAGIFQLGLSFLLLVAAALLLPHVWKDRPGASFTLKWRSLLSRWRYGAAQERHAFRTRLLQLNPFAWLASRHRWASSTFVLFGFLVFLAAISLAKKLIPAPGTEEEIVFPLLFTFGAVAFLHVGLAFRIAILACDRFSTDRKSGALELLLSTPLTIKDILRGQWIALFRHLWAGILLVLAAHFCAVWWFAELLELEARREVSLASLIDLFRLYFSGQDLGFNWEPIVIPFVPLVAAFLIIYSWAPLAWLSMWLGLRLAVQVRAPWSALCLIYLPPWPVFGAIMGFLNYTRSIPPDNFMSFILVILLLSSLIIINATFWMWWARRQLRRHFRSAATDRYSLFRKRGWFARLLFGKPNFESIH